jgi:hypothetical protein
MKLLRDQSRGWFFATVLFSLIALSVHGHSQSSVVQSATRSGSGLVSQLTKGLSVTPTQARGGAGALFALAKTRLTADEFTKVSSAVPGMSSLLKAAPAVGGSSELSSLEGTLPGGMGRLAEVAEAFHKLGMSPEMAGKFVPVITKYVKARGGLSTASLLEKALK